MKEEKNTEKLAGLILKIAKAFGTYMILAILAVGGLIAYALIF